MAKSKNELKLIIEAALFASEVPLKIKRLISLFPERGAPSKEEVRAALSELESDYAERGIELRRVGKAYRFQSREKYSPWLRKINEGRPPRYSRALLETLAIIAYRQPVTRGDIEEIRGVSVSSETMRTLLDREWVRSVGQREVAGRPNLFGTTQKFLEYFNLASLSDLPPLMEKREPTEIAQELNLRLPLEHTEPESSDDESAPESEEHEQHTAEIIHLDTGSDKAQVNSPEEDSGDNEGKGGNAVPGNN